MRPAVRLDHSVVAVSDWGVSNRFYRDVVGAELVPIGPGRVSYRLGDTQLNVHGPGVDVSSDVARIPVEPGNSDLCFVWPGPIAEAVAHLERQGVAVESGPVERFGASGPGTSIYFRDPDGSLLEFQLVRLRRNSGLSRQGSRSQVPGPVPLTCREWTVRRRPLRRPGASPRLGTRSEWPLRPRPGA